jgi:hypothetical protein
MDPTVTYDEMIAAAKDGDWDAVAEHVENLSTWLARGGFEPKRPNWRATFANLYEQSRTRQSGQTVAGTMGGMS